MDEQYSPQGSGVGMPQQPLVPAQALPMQSQQTVQGQPNQTGYAPYTPQQPVGDAYKDYGWSWGAAMFGPLFLIGIRKYVYLLPYILMFIPIVTLLVMLAMFAFLGFKGRELALQSLTFTSKDQYLGYMKANDHAGKVMFFVCLIVFISAFVIGPTFVDGLDDAAD